MKGKGKNPTPGSIILPLIGLSLWINQYNTYDKTFPNIMQVFSDNEKK